MPNGWDPGLEADPAIARVAPFGPTVGLTLCVPVWTLTEDDHLVLHGKAARGVGLGRPIATARAARSCPCASRRISRRPRAAGFWIPLIGNGDSRWG